MRYYSTTTFSLLVILAFAIVTKSVAQEIAVSGTVTDKSTGEVLIGVRLAIFHDTLQSVKPLRLTRTNKYGFYSLPALLEGSYFLVAESFGYARFMRQITAPISQGHLNIALAPKDIRLNDISIEAKRPLSPTAISTIEISPQRLRQLPAIGSEVDVMRALQLMPGVKAGSEISSGLFVRGGSPDQNLTLLDGVPLYNPGHLMGIFSAFNADAISDIRLYKGVFPAEFGGRLSSVLDITMKEGNRERFGGKAELSFLTARLTLEGPIGEKASFLVTGRRMYYDLIARLFNGDRIQTYSFYDLTAKVNCAVSDRDKLFVSGYFGRDEIIPFGRPGIQTATEWGNATAHLRWTHIFSPTLFSTVSASYTNYGFFFGDRIQGDVAKTEGVFQSRSRIDDLNAKAEIQWTPAQEHLIKTGLEATQHRFRNFLYAGTFGALPTMSPLADGEAASALEAAVFSQDEWSITPDFIASVGVRGSYFSNGGHLRIEPRVSAVYKLNPDISLKGGYGITHQFVQMASQGAVSLPTETWFPSAANLQPSRSTQIAGGTEVYLFDREFLLTAEAYYKTMENLYEFREDAEFRSGAPLATQLTRGNGTAYGLELFLNKQIGQWTGWIGYTLSWTQRQFDELNGGKPFFARFDRLHEFQLTGSYKLNDVWEFGAVFVLSSGQPMTMPVGFANFYLTAPDNQFRESDKFPYLMSGIPTSGHYLYSERNGVRMAAYHRLDLSATHKFIWFNLPFVLGINVYNVYARNNPYLYYIQSYGPPPTQPGPPTEPTRVRVLQYSFFTIIPSVSLSFTF
jgi:hypothetical protein